jgi:uncharacterized protein (DUF983 family)
MNKRRIHQKRRQQRPEPDAGKPTVCPGCCASAIDRGLAVAGDLCDACELRAAEKALDDASDLGEQSFLAADARLARRQRGA